MKTFIYGLFDPRNEQVIKYVGHTENLGNRIAAHRSCGDKTTGLWVKMLNREGIPVGFRVIEHSDDLNGPTRERFWISHYNAISPLLNGACAPVSEFEFRISPIMSLRDMELAYLKWTVDYFNGNKLAAARALGIGRQTLYNKLAANRD